MATAVRQVPIFECLVCGKATKHYHLETTMCGPCSSFYRRTIRERLSYECDNAGRCAIGQSNQRLACRYCRLKRCEQSGARLPNQDNRPPTMNAIQLPSMLTSKTKVAVKQPILEQLLRGYKHYVKAEHSVLAISHPEIQISADKLITVQKLEALELKTKFAPLILDFYNQNFGPFSKLTKEQQQKVASNTYHNFDLLHKGCLSAPYADQLNEWSAITNAGSYVNFNPIYSHYYYQNYLPSEIIDQYVEASLPILKKMLRIIARFAELKMRQVDAVALMLINLCNKVEHENLLTSELVAYKDAMLEEWSANLKAEYGSSESAHKLAQMMAYFYDLNNVSEQIAELGVLQQMFLRKYDVQAMCGVVDFMEKLDLGEKSESAQKVNS
ncbi:hypothetical protein M3Y94_01265600 [Aphelenchoides besseyi]|nr:hypothetical protein M3Y94_01265600 [Aphelenchoides besseyi]KAI6222586.1 Steroid receptor seven-up, isoforms B/C [Aphelenchoides besseyi]